MKLPAHIAIIMDGNGRWAQERGLPRTFGHLEGVNSVRAVTEECTRLGIRQLTLYTFSSENWKRPAEEITFLMGLLREYLVKEREEMVRNGIRLTAIGRLGELPRDVQGELAKTKEITSGGTRLTLCLALNYGGRGELVDAARGLADAVARGTIRPDQIDEQLFARHLYTADMPDPDLLIRTAGEMRLSNFLLYQLSYAEFYVTEVCWPDFREEQLRKAIEEYGRRIRTFGGLGEGNGV